MVEPEKVEYGKTKVLKLVHNEDKFSIALLSFNDNVVYGMRWNGIESEKSKGTPVSHGKSTWFILPNELVEGFIKIKVKGANI